MQVTKMIKSPSQVVNEWNDSMILPHPGGVVASGSEEGSVLMSVGGNVILRLNEVATLIWQVLEEGRDKGGLGTDEVLHGLVQLLEGCLVEQVPQKLVERDVYCFLDDLLQRNLLLVITDSDTDRRYQIPDGIFWSKK